MSVITATWEAKVGESQVEGTLGNLPRPILKNKQKANTKKKHECMSFDGTANCLV